MNLTDEQKQNLIKIYQKSQDILDTCGDLEKEEFCCHAICVAQGLYRDDESSLAYEYFCWLFRPEDTRRNAWLTDTELSYEDQQHLRLMVLQICELSLS